MAHDAVVQPPQRPPDGRGDHRHGDRHRRLGAERPADGPGALGQVADQTDHVIGDGGDRQPFHRGLQLELHALAPVHRGQQLAAALLLLDLDAGAQQAAHALDALRQRRLPAVGRAAGAHGRRQAPLHEVAHRLHAFDARFGDVGQAAIEQFVVRRAGGKAGMGRRVLAFQIGGQARQAIEQGRLVLACGAAHGLRQLRQFQFGVRQLAGRLARQRQAEQGGHAVGLDLQQPLHQPPQPAWRHLPRRHRAGEHQHARKAVGMHGQVGEQVGAVADDGGAGQRVLAQQAAHQRHLIERALRQSPQVQAEQVLARQRAQPALRHDVDGAGRRSALRHRLHIAIGQRANEGPGDEFSVALPAQRVRAQIGTQVAGVVFRRGLVQAVQQFGQVRAAGVAARLVGQHDDVRNRQRRRQRFGRAGVDLVVQQRALRVLGEGHGGAMAAGSVIVHERHLPAAKRTTAPQGAVAAVGASAVTLRRRPLRAWISPPAAAR